MRRWINNNPLLFTIIVIATICMVEDLARLVAGK